MDSLDKEIIADYKNGSTIIQISAKYNKSPVYISDCLKLNNVKIYTSRGPRSITPIPRKEILDDHKKGMSISNLSKKYNLSNYLIKRELAKL
jgi:Mor family transcriptional regulator